MEGCSAEKNMGRDSILWQYLAVNKSKGEYSAPVFKIGYHSLFGGMKF